MGTPGDVPGPTNTARARIGAHRGTARGDASQCGFCGEPARGMAMTGPQISTRRE